MVINLLPSRRYYTWQLHPSFDPKAGRARCSRWPSSPTPISLQPFRSGHQVTGKPYQIAVLSRCKDAIRSGPHPFPWHICCPPGSWPQPQLPLPEKLRYQQRPRSAMVARLPVETIGITPSAANPTALVGCVVIEYVVSGRQQTTES